MSIIHTWEKQEIKLNANNSYDNPYVEVDVWVDLEGPNFKKRIYGFWDGENDFKIRIAPTSPGKWKWISGSNQQDSGLNNKSGEFWVEEWSEEEKKENPSRRGFIKPSNNGHALTYNDGTPFFMLGDTWWGTATYRYKWFEDDRERSIGPEMGFKDMVKYRKNQGFNSIAMIAGFPHWANDGNPSNIKNEEGTVIRGAWQQPGTESAQDMHNEGGRPFLFPGKVPGYETVFPDLDKINPDYFKHLDKKIDYLNSQGFIPFIEIARRDISQAWKKYYDWPISYTRYIQYVFSRYHANNCILSPIHMDTDHNSIPTREYNEPINLFIEKYGYPPFGNLMSTNAHFSNYKNFGGPEEADWLKLYQTGNQREHDHYWYLTEIYNLSSPRPALNGEPYYAGCPYGWPEGEEPEWPEEDELYCRSGMYGSVLSGGLAGHIYGAQGIWQGSIEDDADIKMWEAIKWKSAEYMKYLYKFIMMKGMKYQELIPNSELITPNKSGKPIGYKGWAYCAGTKEKDFFLLYFEKDCPQSIFRGAIPGKKYRGKWFNPRTGEQIVIDKMLIADKGTGRFEIPAFPTDEDWALSLEIINK